ncbi:hypothetical protein JTE90_023304 [Oedothorax gibbosus]|uniref:Uncharacterized protein n=1 Tax=Oedothorax gibbosus TaxID=931172 RepID=A0AAV6UN33_9ARAC|nr:hypothetical protein JTE90_023304 [Oedothorax gibbosus]
MVNSIKGGEGGLLLSKECSRERRKSQKSGDVAFFSNAVDERAWVIDLGKVRGDGKIPRIFSLPSVRSRGDVEGVGERGWQCANEGWCNHVLWSEGSSQLRGCAHEFQNRERSMTPISGHGTYKTLEIFSESKGNGRIRSPFSTITPKE